MKRRTLLILAAGALAVLALAWFLHWRSAAVQAPRTFARLSAAFARGDARLLVAQLHPDYDLRAQWPQLFAELGEEGMPSMQPRPLAELALRELFRQQQGDPFVLACELHEVTSADDGQVTVLVSMRLGTSGGGSGPVAIDPPIVRHRFVLQRNGLFSGSLAIVGHDRIGASH